MDVLTAIVGSVVSFGAGWIVRPYIIKRSEQQAEYDAIIANLGVIKTKVETTERATAEIKAEVDHKGWRERERLVLMRTKLESTLSAAFELSETLDLLSRADTETGESNRVEVARNKLNMLTTLYFPQLRATAFAVRTTSLTLSSSYVEMWGTFRVYRAMYNADPNAANTAAAYVTYETARQRHNEQHPQIYGQFLNALWDFSKAAEAEMEQYAL